MKHDQLSPCFSGEVPSWGVSGKGDHHSKNMGEGVDVRQIVEITPVTLKRLRNYGQVAENKTKIAHKKQWMAMTLENMQEYQEALKHSDYASAVVGYASFLFRVQNGMTPPRILYGEQLLRNTLVHLLKELNIPIVLVDVPADEHSAIIAPG
jgi:hypothetical protein